MSNSPNRKQRRDTHRERVLKATSLEASRAQGCICDPIVRRSENHTADFPQYQVLHDDWCPMVNHGSQIVIRHRRAEDN